MILLDYLLVREENMEETNKNFPREKPLKISFKKGSLKRQWKYDSEPLYFHELFNKLILSNFSREIKVENEIYLKLGCFRT